MSKKTIEVKGSSLTVLADNLIKELKQSDDFFKTSIVVFPNIKVSKWFKSYWLKTQKDILMNVKYLTIDEALYELIETKEKYKLADDDIIKVMIVKILVDKKDSLPDNLKNYFYKDGQLDSIKLYDLALELTKVFKQYEKSNYNFDSIDEVKNFYNEMKGDKLSDELKKYEIPDNISNLLKECDENKLKEEFPKLEEKENLIKAQKDIYDDLIKELESKKYSTLKNIYNNRIGFKKYDQPIYFFGFAYFEPLQKQILDEYVKLGEIVIYSLEEKINANEVEDINKKVFAAPSKLKEIESVHSKICKIMLENDDARYNDFLIIAPDVSEYETSVNQVFKQDNENYLDIPYVISSKKGDNQEIISAIQKFIDIKNAGFYTRKDLYELLNNKVIQKVRNINDEEVESIMKTLISMNVYRGTNDWVYAKKRILINKLVNNDLDDYTYINFGEEKIIPYSKMFFDDDLAVKFIKMIVDLDNLLSTFNDIKFIDDKDNIEKLQLCFDKFFSIKNESEIELNNFYFPLLKIFNTWKNNICSNENKIPLNVFLYFLKDASSEVVITRGEHFINGVTFVDFNANSIYACKYVFFIGMNSKKLPLVEVKSELDVRNIVPLVRERQRQSFLFQLANALDKLYISYLYVDLKTDAELFPSSFIVGIKDFDPEKIIKENIDETRDWKDLFTKKEFRAKEYYLNLSSATNEENKEKTIEENKVVKKFSTNDLKNYLEEPLLYKANRLFGKENDITDDLNEEFEKFALNNLEEYSTIKEILLYMLNHKKQSLEEDDEKKILEKLELKKRIPLIHDEIEKNIFNELKQEAEATYSWWMGVAQENNSNLEMVNLEDLSLNADGIDWILTCSEEFCLVKNDSKRIYFEIRGQHDKYEFKNIIKTYVFALMDIAKQNDDVEYEISLSSGCSNKKIEFKLNANKSKEILNKIFVKMNDYKENICFPIGKINEKTPTFIGYFESIMGPYAKGSWSYSNHQKSFMDEELLGFSTDEENFEKEFNEYKEKMKEILPMEGDDNNE